jgi:hypothetical protein
MARKPLRHQATAHEQVRRDVGRSMRDAVDASRASRGPAARLYGAGGPRGRPPGEPTPPSDHKTLSAAQAHSIERAAGPLGGAVIQALTSAGLIAGARSAARSSTPPPQDRGGYVSPLGGQAK